MSELDASPLSRPPKRRWPLFVGPLLGAAVVLVVVASLVRDASTPRTPVRVAEVKRGEVHSRVLAQGSVRAKRQVEVGSEITGRVTDVLVRVGDAVRVGDTLFTLDDEQYRVQVKTLRVALRAASAMLDRARLAAAEAERNHARDTKLRERGVLAEDVVKASAARVQLVSADLRQAEAAVERARLDLARAEDALAKAKVVAPIDGTVVAVNLEVGQVAAPTAGLSSQPAFAGLGLGGTGGDPGATVVVADLSELLARLDVDELDVAQVKEGQDAVLTAQGRSEERYHGKVTLVGLMGREVGGAVQFPVEVVVTPSAGGSSSSAPGGANADAGVDDERDADDRDADGGVAALLAGTSLRPGMSVSAEIIVERLPDAVYAPVAAVLEGDGKDKPDRVFVVEDGIGGAVAKERAVTLGPTDEENIAVREGLTPGERVVEGPFRALRGLEDGDPITPEDASVSDGERAGREGRP